MRGCACERSCVAGKQSTQSNLIQSHCHTHIHPRNDTHRKRAGGTAPRSICTTGGGPRPTRPRSRGRPGRSSAARSPRPLPPQPSRRRGACARPWVAAARGSSPRPALLPPPMPPPLTRSWVLSLLLLAAAAASAATLPTPAEARKGPCRRVSWLADPPVFCLWVIEREVSAWTGTRVSLSLRLWNNTRGV